MGLFGLFATLFCGGAAIHDSMEKSSMQRSSRQDALNSGKPFYSHLGEVYDTLTNEKCYTVRNGANVIIKTPSGRIVADMAEIKNREEREKAIREGKKYYRRMWNPKYNVTLRSHTEIATGKMYILERKNTCSYSEKGKYDWYDIIPDSSCYDGYRKEYRRTLEPEEAALYKEIVL